MLKPHWTEETMANRPPITVNKPFIPQAHAMEPFGRDCSVNIPRGNGIPIKKPAGKINIRAILMRIGRGIDRKMPCVFG